MENSGSCGVDGVECRGGIGCELQLQLILGSIQILEEVGPVVQTHAVGGLGTRWAWSCVMREDLIHKRTVYVCSELCYVCM